MNAADLVDWSLFDFIDLGCSTGRSINYCRQRFAAQRGLGIDRDPAKVAEAHAAGFDAVVAEAADVPPDVRVRFVSMLDFLD